MEVGAGNPAGAADSRDDFSTGNLLLIAHQIDLIVRVHRNDAAAMADNDDITVTAQLIAVNDLAMLDRPDRRSLRRTNIESVMETRAARAKSRIDGAAHRPQKHAIIAVRGHTRPVILFPRRNNLDRQLPGRSRYEYFLTDGYLAWVSDAVRACQFMRCRVVGFTDAEQVLARPDDVENTLRARRRSSRPRCASDK